MRSRGAGSKAGAAGPLPSPFCPWQPRQLCSKTAAPRFRKGSHVLKSAGAGNIGAGPVAGETVLE